MHDDDDESQSQELTEEILGGSPQFPSVYFLKIHSNNKLTFCKYKTL